MSVLFVTNGHGEVAIAARIARELSGVTCDHLALVGDFAHPSVMRDVGPRKAMPSGGLVAMGNVRNIARDVAAGLVAHTIAQLRFTRSVRGQYETAVAVGDVFALIVAFTAKARSTIFVGTAKSVHHAPYGPVEERIIAKARKVFVRDFATAARLRDRGVLADPANVIVDLYSDEERGRFGASFDTTVAVFPGSRDTAYADAIDLTRIVREAAKAHAGLGGALSIAPGLDVARFADGFARDGWRVTDRGDARTPFSLYDGEREVVRAWRGDPGAILAGASVALGQAGTANEAAAAGGIPVVAYERSGAPSNAWYRARQAGLLGDALTIVSGDAMQAAQELLALLDDAQRRERMGRIGRERMGPPGGAKLIAGSILATAAGVRA